MQNKNCTSTCRQSDTRTSINLPTKGPYTLRTPVPRCCQSTTNRKRNTTTWAPSRKTEENYVPIPGNFSKISERKRIEQCKRGNAWERGSWCAYVCVLWNADKTWLRCRDLVELSINRCLLEMASDTWGSDSFTTWIPLWSSMSAGVAPTLAPLCVYEEELRL